MTNTKLRLLFKDALLLRLQEHAPDVLGDAFNRKDVQALIEQITFKLPGNDYFQGHSPVASFEGIIRAELITTLVDDVDLTELWVALLEKPIRIAPDQDGDPGSIQIDMDTQLTTDALIFNGVQWVAGLRFRIDGSIYRKDHLHCVPDNVNVRQHVNGCDANDNGDMPEPTTLHPDQE